MKTLATIPILILISFCSLAQGWQQLNSPTTKDIISSSFISDDEGWIGTINTGAATLYHTADGGNTWNSITITGASGGSSYIEFITSNSGFAVVNGEAFKTTDGGSTWTQMTMPDVPFNEPYFLNEDTGFISGQYEVFKTVDGGNTWLAKYYESYDAVPLYRIAFLDDATGIATDGEEAVYLTSDAGENWYCDKCGGLWNQYTSVWYTDDGMWITGYEDVLGDIADYVLGPHGWYAEADASGLGLADIRFFGNYRGYAVGAEGFVLSTENKGYTWTDTAITSVALNVLDGVNDIYVFGDIGKGFKRSAYCATGTLFTYIPNGLEVEFTDESLIASSWLWDFGDGTFSTDQSPVHTFPALGEYEVCLTATSDSCGSAILCQTVKVCAANSSASLAGTLDTSFSSDGIATDNIIGSGESVGSLLIQSDGKIIAAGNGFNPGIARYNTDGTMDSTFDEDGMLDNIQLSSFTEAALTPDGKIIIAGKSYPDLQLNRYNSDGTIDSSFGNNGIVIADLSQQNEEDEFVSLTVRTDGKILVYGYYDAPSETLAVALFNADGTPDLSFAGDGIANLENLDDADADKGDITVQQDGRILLSGNITGLSADYAFLTIRLKADGSIDSSFGTAGLVFTNFVAGSFNYEFAQTVIEQPDGKVLVAGYANGPFDDHYAVTRYHSDGALDSAFGSDGKVIFQIEGMISRAEDAVLQADGKILLAGYFGDDGNDKIGLVRLMANGTMDSTFGTNGIVVTNVNCEVTRASSVAIDNDKIYVGGSHVLPNNYNSYFLVARYITKCQPAPAGFTYSLTGLGVQFTDQSADSIAWLWDFGDGNTSTLQNPSHTYATEGSYNVCLIITDSCGSNTACESVTVCNPLNTDFLYQQNGLSIQMLNQITEADSFFWDFEDGTTSTDQNPVHTFPSSGTYHVCLLEWDACASDTICKELVVCGALTTDFIYTATDLSVEFTDASVNAVSWNWDFGDGNFSSDQNPLHEYSIPGIYNACLSTFNGCSYDTLCQSITIIASSTGFFTNQYSLISIYPNPFSYFTTISFSLEEKSHTTIELFDLAGRRLATLFDGNVAEGDFILDRGSLSPGIYFIQLKTRGSGLLGRNKSILTHKLIIQ